MIYLIGGASHTGKTNLAQKLMVKYQIPYVSMDHVKMGIVRAGLVPNYVEEDDKMQEILWPVIREMIKTAVENEQNMIMEGCYIPYNRKDEFDADYLEDIRCMFLVMSTDYIEKHFEDIRNFASVIEDRGEDEDCTKEWILQINKEYLDGCRQYGCEYKLVTEKYDVDEEIFETTGL